MEHLSVQTARANQGGQAPSLRGRARARRPAAAAAQFVHRASTDPEAALHALIVMQVSTAPQQRRFLLEHAVPVGLGSGALREAPRQKHVTDFSVLLVVIVLLARAVPALLVNGAAW